MKIAIFGSRDCDSDKILKLLEMKGVHKETDIYISTGDATGADEAARKLIKKYNLNHTIYCASKSKYITLSSEFNCKLISDWEIDGKGAGPKRNSALINDSDKGVAFWDGASTGTLDSIKKAIKNKKVIQIIPSDLI